MTKIHECRQYDTKELWDILTKRYSECGKILSIPKGTDFNKTYAWRHLKRIEENIFKLGIDKIDVDMFVTVAVKYLSTRRMLCKGLQPLTVSNIFLNCYNEFEQYISSRDTVVASIQAQKDWLDNITHGDWYSVLSKKRDFKSNHVLTEYYNSGKLTTTMLALSRSCLRAIDHISKRDQIERCMLPSISTLYSLWSEKTQDTTLKNQLKNVLQNEWRDSSVS